MIEILEFIFQSFWHWLGTVILIAVILVPFGSIRTLLRIKRDAKNKTEDMNKKKHVLDFYEENTSHNEKEYYERCLIAFVIVGITFLAFVAGILFIGI